MLGAGAVVGGALRAVADVPLAGIALGANVTAVAQTLGIPQSVASVDSGQRFVFTNGATAYTDDDGFVLAVETHTGTPAVEVEGTPRRFAVGHYTAARADAELAEVAEFAAPGERSYRIAPRRDLVLTFDAATDRLSAAIYGEPGQLARLGMLPGDAAAKAVVFHAPQPRSGLDVPAGTLAAVYRIGIDRAGAVTAAAVFIPSAQPARDAAVVPLLLRTHYVPATLDGRPIAATVFIELHHA